MINHRLAIVMGWITTCCLVLLACGKYTPTYSRDATATAWGATVFAQLDATQTYMAANGVTNPWPNSTDLAASGTQIDPRLTPIVIGNTPTAQQVAEQPTDRVEYPTARSAPTGTPVPLAQPKADPLQSLFLSANSTANAAGAQLTAAADAKDRAERAKIAGWTAEAADRAWAVTATNDSAVSTGVAAQKTAVEVARLVQALNTPTPDLKATSAAGIAAAESTAVAAQAYNAYLASQRAEMVNQLKAFLPYVIFLAVVVVVLVIGWKWTDAEINRRRFIKRDERGLLPLFAGKDGLVEQDKNPAPAVGLGKGKIELPVNPNSELQRQTTARAQAVQMAIGGLPGQPARRIRTAPAQPAPAAGQGQNGSRPARPPAPWASFLDAGGPQIPLGMAPNGVLQSPDLDEWPHRLFAGKTGAGKSRYGIRPYIAGALGRGWNVVSISDRAPVDFKIFEHHPNFHVLQLDEPAQAIQYLVGINLEIKRRGKLLYDAGASTWSRLDRPEPRVAVVIDELAAMLDDLRSTEKYDFVHQLANISRLARKVGIHLVVGVQNPTADNLKPTIRRNCLPVAFSVVDATASRAVLEIDGAEKLIPPEYLTRMSDVTPGIGFDPSDEQIRAYLDLHQQPTYDPPSFLIKLPEPEAPAEALPAYGPETIDLAELIRDGWQNNLSKRKLANLVGHEYEGAFCKKLDAAIDYLTATTTATTTTKKPGQAGSGSDSSSSEGR